MAAAVAARSPRAPRGFSVYWELARVGYRRYATYRGATIAGVFTNTVFGFLRAYVLIALSRRGRTSAATVSPTRSPTSGSARGCS